MRIKASAANAIRSAIGNRAKDVANFVDADTFELALREAVRQGRVAVSKDYKGRDVYSADVNQ